MNTLSSFHIGQRVTLSRVKHESFRGHTATVLRLIKKWNQAYLRLDDGRLYDAYPENIDAA